MLPSLDTYVEALRVERSLALARVDRLAPLTEGAERAPATHGARRRPIPATRTLLTLLVGALLLGAALVPLGAGGEGTPPAGVGSGVTTEVLGRMEVAQAPGQALFLLRVTFAPGGAVTAHVHPGATVYHLAAGTLQFTLLEGEARLVRAVDGAPAAATPSAAEAIAVGQELTLAAGDTVYYDGSAAQAERNDGDAPAVVLVSNLRGADEPTRRFVDGTPTGS